MVRTVYLFFLSCIVWFDCSALLPSLSLSCQCERGQRALKHQRTLSFSAFIFSSGFARLLQLLPYSMKPAIHFVLSLY